MTFRILAALSMILLSAPSALGVQRALAPTRGELAGWLAALGIELAYLSLAFIEFADVQRQRNAARVAKTAVATAIVLNVLADYAARVPAGLTGAAAFLATFDWLLLVLSVLESAPLAGLAYTLAVLLHTRSSKQYNVDDASSMLASADTTASSMLASADRTASSMLASTEQMLASTATAASSMLASTEQMLASTATDQHPPATYACPRCGAALSKQQYAAARRYGCCAKCKQ